MRKKLIFFVLAISLIAGGYFYFSQNSTHLPDYCAFCQREVLERQEFYEDAFVYALYTHKPITPGHCLIIPKRHVVRFEELTDEEVKHLGAVIKKVNQASANVFHSSSYLLLQKNGPEAGQTVPHVHFHYIPRNKNEGSLKFLLKMYIANIKKPLAKTEMQKIVEAMKQAIGWREVSHNELI